MRRRRPEVAIAGALLVLTLWGIPPRPADPQRAHAELRALMARGASDAELQALERAYPRTPAAALARFLRGYRKYLAWEYAAALPLLSDPLIAEKTQLGDYALSFAAKSLLAMGRAAEGEESLMMLWRSFPHSRLARSAVYDAARSALDRGEVQTALARLSPLVVQGDAAAHVLQAEGYQKLGQRERALALLERVYFDLPPTRESATARDLLLRLGVNVDDVRRYAPERVRRRADRLYDAGAYEEAARAYRALVRAFPEMGRDEALRVRWGVSLFHARALREAISVLRPAAEQAKNPELQAEAFYYLAESARRLGETDEFLEMTRRLLDRFPHSSWAARALAARAQFYMRNQQREEALQQWRRLIALHPHSDFAPEAFWQIGWAAYRHGQDEEAARTLLRLAAEHPQSEYFAQAVYWAARALERQGQIEQARLLYEKLRLRYHEAYYGQMARRRLDLLREPKRARSTSSEMLLDRVLALLQPVRPPEETARPETLRRVEKALELRLIRLDDLALEELKAAQREAPDSPRVGLELARLYRDRGDPLAAINALRQAHPEYAAYRGQEVSDEVFRLLFPLTHWDLIRQNAAAHGLDPYLLAGLIRQESSFHPRARSVANARGLMQLIPSTGRLVARRYGLRRLSPERLYDPALNLRLGTAYLAEQLKRFGRLEYALAAYNAGPLRVARWLQELPHREVEEWIESIPITETRQYVKSVLRNAAHYRRIYGSS